MKKYSIAFSALIVFKLFPACVTDLPQKKEYLQAYAIIQKIFQLSFQEKYCKTLNVYPANSFDPTYLPTIQGYAIEFQNDLPLYLHFTLGSWRFLRSANVLQDADKDLKSEILQSFNAKLLEKKYIKTSRPLPLSASLYQLEHFEENNLPSVVFKDQPIELNGDYIQQIRTMNLIFEKLEKEQSKPFWQK